MTCLDGEMTLAYARAELERVGAQLLDETPGALADISLRVMDQPDVADPLMDDLIEIDVSGRSGVIAGSNPRSVLLGVYRYLREQGCRWVRPGVAGEYISRGAGLRDVHRSWRPTVRHRGVCIEGAVSRQHVLDMIEWLPRNGCNAYFTQFRESYTFFDRWYSGLDSDREGVKITPEEARNHLRACVDAIRQRGLLYHAVGHGWTCEPFGMAGLGWDTEDVAVPEGVQPLLAEVNGTRGLWGGVPLNTNLCYSNPAVRATMAQDIVRYAREHPEVHLLHIWLADGSNNNCECAACRVKRPSDWYVVLLNETCKLLRAESLPTRLVFLIYVDLLWPPVQERFDDPERLVLMFAPITRSYSSPYPSVLPQADIPPFELNKLQFPRGVDTNLALLAGWRKAFDGDSFDFDYHLMWDHYHDPGYMQIAKVLHDDMKALPRLGINGLISCQVQRSFYPTGLPMAMLSETPWSDQPFDVLAEDYLRACYGTAWGSVLTWLNNLTEAFCPQALRGEREADYTGLTERIAQINAPMADLAQSQLLCGEADVCRTRSWQLLLAHVSLTGLQAEVLETRQRGDGDANHSAWSALRQWYRTHEPMLHPELDTWLAPHVWRRHVIKEA